MAEIRRKLAEKRTKDFSGSKGSNRIKNESTDALGVNEGIEKNARLKIENELKG
ncbi:MAG: hypothetical protein ACTSVZ_10850 [Promethearchaeota archaeon]